MNSKGGYIGSHESDGEKKTFQSMNYEEFQSDVQSSASSFNARNKMTRKYVLEMWDKIMRERGLRQ